MDHGQLANARPITVFSDGGVVNGVMLRSCGAGMNFAGGAVNASTISPAQAGPPVMSVRPDPLNRNTLHAPL
jgi:hypothetical protein